MLREDINYFLNEIDNNVCVVAATKYVDSTQMLKLYNAGVTNFGENRVDSFLTKYEELKDYPITWHFIGHLQRNKAKLIANKIDYLHSLDSLELAKMLNNLRDKPLNTFIEVSINLEETKNGVEPDKVYDFIKDVLQYKNINVIGLMMMTVKYSNHDELISQFKALSDLKDKLESKLKIKLPYLSMGMSDDYKEAISCGATHIRLGRILWKI